LAKVALDEVGRSLRHLQVLCLAQYLIGLGERANRHPIPSRDDLVVQMGTRTASTNLEQFFLG
jgi:hypothetical protein